MTSTTPAPSTDCLTPPDALETQLAAIRELDRALAGSGLPATPRPTSPSGSAQDIARWAAARLQEASGDAAALADPATGVERLASAVERGLGIDVMVGAFGADTFDGISCGWTGSGVIVLNADHPRRSVTRALFTSIGHIVAYGPWLDPDDALIRFVSTHVSSAVRHRVSHCFADALQPLLGYKVGPLVGCDDAHAAMLTLRGEDPGCAGSLWQRPGRRPPGLLAARCVQGLRNGAVRAEALSGLLGCDTALLRSALCRA